MVDIAQLVSASDCGSEGRGFESHYPPHKKRTPSWVFFFYGMNGIRKPDPGAAGVRNSPVDCFLGRGRIPAALTAPQRGVGKDADPKFAQHPFGCPLFLSDYGTRTIKCPPNGEACASNIENLLNIHGIPSPVCPLARNDGVFRCVSNCG